ncbi:GPI anchor biosynthesis protein [Grosmannia clavigera kw1407]|uniref:GPI-anchored wall transfer protein n=1 Tax=Grosmannia clavigera (strain kw1407 / UAMH 11150) TaxID=655863 RepID=F0XU49_GROCL|nr:GPI anchor biosynthesis protein [Grosmannia clavigera kw1407]EFW98508.1 GPI anchor biosynthesis protein [Grosmannia clavigera kw1407]
MSDAGPVAAAASAAANYKKLKEDFVSGLSGGSAGEVNLVTAVAPVAILAWSVLQRRQSFFRPYTLLAFIVDFCLNVGAILLAITLYADRPVLLSSILIAQSVFVYALPRNVGDSSSRRVRVPKRPKDVSSSRLSELPKKSFLTAYRGCMLVVTCLAILAVDFRVFPRRFAKVETWGTSLMDMGVGSFVFSAGVVAARPVLKERLAAASSGGRTLLARRLLTSLRHSLPLLVLGIIRLLSVKGLDYAEHVTEYGVHWNFFFTLGLLPPFVAVAQSALRFIPSYAALAVLLAGVYEAALDFTDLKAYALTAPRVSLLSKNREGVFSFVGYLTIFLAGQDTGLYVLPRGRPASPAASPLLSWLRRNRLPAWAVAWTALHQLTISRPAGLGLTESRRLANLPYVLWVLSFNTVQLTMFSLVDAWLFSGMGEAKDVQAEEAVYEEATSPVLRAYNRNGLAVFLLANLLTGLVNLTVPTLDASPALSMGILVAYAGSITLVAVALDKCDITIKL